MSDLVLTFDVGTQSTRGMIVDSLGNILVCKQEKYKVPYYSSKVGYAEQKPDFYYETILSIGNYLKENNAELLKNVKGVTITCFRDSVLCLDENNKPLRDVILWLDKREADKSKLKPLPFYKRFLFSLVGVKDVIEMQQRQSICNWIMSEEKELWDKTKKYVFLPTYLNYKMTGKLIDTVANQIGHVPIDYRNKKWMSKNGLTRCLFDVNNDKLCGLTGSGEIVGSLLDEVCDSLGVIKGTPFISTGSDKSCETLGLSVLNKNQAAISFGTSATIQFATKDYFEPQSFAPSYPACINEYYNPEFQIYRGFWMVSWFINNFCYEEKEEAKKLNCSVEEILDKHLKDAPLGCNGLTLQPYWSPGVTNPNAKGAIIGFNDSTNKYHVYRSIIEGILFELYYGLKKMSKRGKQTISDIYVGGGGSISNEVCQMCSDVFGLPVHRIQTNEACGLGSSIIGFVTLDVYKSYEEAISKMVRIKDTFTPNESNHLLYQKIYTKVYKKIYKKNLPIYMSMKGVY